MQPLTTAAADPASHVRALGALKLGAGLLVMSGVWWLGYALLSPVVFVLGLSGLMELATGTPWHRTASRWSELRPWQRGLASLLVVLATIAFFIGVGAVAVALND
jgi:hypothetical protein